MARLVHKLVQDSTPEAQRLNVAFKEVVALEDFYYRRLELLAEGVRLLNKAIHNFTQLLNDNRFGFDSVFQNGKNPFKDVRKLLRIPSKESRVLFWGPQSCS